MRRALVAGGGGFLGLAIVKALAATSIEPRALVRTEAQGTLVRAAGGTPVLGDVLDRASVGRAAEGCDAIVHVAARFTGEPGSEELARRVRVEGTSNLAAAARAHGVRRLVVGSGYWVYAGQPGLITEASRVDPQGESKINFEAEQVGFEANAPGELDVLVVRPGMVYGDGAWFRTVVDAIRAGSYRTIGAGSNRWSFADLGDAGTGFVTVLGQGLPGEVYNLVDRAPAPWAEFARFVAERLGVPAPGTLSWEEAVESFGAVVARHLAAERATSAAKLEALGWRPRFPRYREGISHLLASM